MEGSEQEFENTPYIPIGWQDAPITPTVFRQFLIQSEAAFPSAHSFETTESRTKDPDFTTRGHDVKNGPDNVAALLRVRIRLAVFSRNN